MLNHLLIQEGATHPPTRATYLRRETRITLRRTTHPNANHPTSERGRSLFREANLYARTRTRIDIELVYGLAIRARTREFRNERQIYGPARLDFSPRFSLPVFLQGGAFPSNFLAGIPLRDSGAGSRSSCDTIATLDMLRLTERWTDTRDYDVISVCRSRSRRRFSLYVTVTKNTCDADVDLPNTLLMWDI